MSSGKQKQRVVAEGDSCNTSSMMQAEGDGTEQNMKGVVYSNCPNGIGASNSNGSVISCDTIAHMADQLGLVSTTRDRANELYKKVKDQSSLKHKSHHVMAGCLYLACREVDNPFTYKEILSVAGDRASVKGIGTVRKIIVKIMEEMGEPMDMHTISAEDYLKRFCSQLNMETDAVQAATDVVKRSETLDLRKTPPSIAATAIYLICQLSVVWQSVDKKLLKAVSQASGVSETTIVKTYKLLYPHAANLIPEWFAKEEDLKRLCAP